MRQHAICGHLEVKSGKKSDERIIFNLPANRGSSLTVYGALMSKDKSFEWMFASKT